MPYEVEVLLEGALKRRVPIDAGGLTIGRQEDNQLVLAHRAVSKQHARLVPDALGLVLTDLGSSTGTLVQHERVKFACLAGGDEFRIGPFTLRIVATHGGTAGTMPGQSGLTERSQGFVRDLDQLELLIQMTRAADHQSVLEALLRSSIAITGAVAGAVLLARDAALSTLIHLGALPEVTIDAIRGHAIGQRVIETRDVVVAPGKSEGEMAVGLPLLENGEVLGVLYLEGKGDEMRKISSDRKLQSRVGVLGGGAMRAALERQQIVRERDSWRWLASTAIEEPSLDRTSGSAAMRRVLHLLHRAAREDVTILLTGETGTGKEVAARTIHRHSKRSSGPFAAINCAALPRDIVEAELFGYEQGAFSGALSQRPGRLELAGDGTLLLDEVGDLPLELQGKLLRVLELRTFERVGGRVPISFLGRLIAATNVDLERAVEKGEFRQDLYYRLNVVTIRLPPLRDRLDDLEPLIAELLTVVNRRFKKRLYGVSPTALQAMKGYRWPGNIRELRNLLERAAFLEASDQITTASLPFSDVPEPDAEAVVDDGSDTGIRPLPEGIPAVPSVHEEMTLSAWTDAHERAYIVATLGRCGGNLTHAARALGLSRMTLLRKMKQLNLR